MSVKNCFLFTIVIALLMSCSAMHNVPESQVPNNFINPNVTSAYVDQNGSFFQENGKRFLVMHLKTQQERIIL